MNNRPKILITGGNGYIGSKLIRSLIDENYSISIILRKNSKLDSLKDIIDRIGIYIYDSLEDIIYILSLVKPDLVIHLASYFVGQHSILDIKKLIHSNIEYGTYILEGMAQSNIKNFINTSTYWLHYNNEDYNPVNLYASTKKAFLDILKYYHELYEINVVNLELSDVYGEDDPRPKLINILKNAIESNTELLLSPGEQFIDLVYIDDVINAYIIATKEILNLNNDIAQFKNYAVTSGEPISVIDLVYKIKRLLNLNCENIKVGLKPYRKREIFTKIQAIKTIEGWKPRIKLETGLRKVFDSFLKYEN